MSGLIVQAGLTTAILMLVGAALLGAAVAALSWLIVSRRRRSSVKPLQVADDSGLHTIFGRLSHSLKSSGEVIRGHLRGFNDELPTDAERWRVARRTIFDEATNITEIVGRLDLVVRLGMAGQPVVMEPVHLPRMIEELMLGLAPAADERQVLLGGVIEQSSSPVDHISGDGAALREVFSNLLHNAVIHGEAGSEITVSIGKNNGRLAVKVRNTGKGIPPEQLDQLFRPGTRTYRPGGSNGAGVGLYLTKLLVEMHGGNISATSDQVRTEFVVSLPVNRVAG